MNQRGYPCFDFEMLKKHEYYYDEICQMKISLFESKLLICKSDEVLYRKIIINEEIYLLLNDKNEFAGFQVNKLSNDDLRLYSIDDYIKELPGYMAQVLTFALMIIFLIVIAAVVIGIFMYVLTVQKASMFGVMKAQGISTNYIAKSVVAQTFILAVIGVGTGLALTIITGLVLPSTVPFQQNIYFTLIISALIILFALLGALFSVRTVAKIDPLEAIG